MIDEITLPTEPGIYGYPTPKGSMVFALDQTGQWWVWNDGIKETIKVHERWVLDGSRSFGGLVRIE